MQSLGGEPIAELNNYRISQTPKTEYRDNYKNQSPRTSNKMLSTDSSYQGALVIC